MSMVRNEEEELEIEEVLKLNDEEAEEPEFN